MKNHVISEQEYQDFLKWKEIVFYDKNNMEMNTIDVQASLNITIVRKELQEAKEEIKILSSIIKIQFNDKERLLLKGIELNKEIDLLKSHAEVESEQIDLSKLNGGDKIILRNGKTYDVIIESNRAFYYIGSTNFYLNNGKSYWSNTGKHGFRNELDIIKHIKHDQ